jgi:phosphoribosylamine--glycine ligase
MRVLIIGGGGREHALAWKLKQDDPGVDLVAAPGNPGIAELADCIPIAATDLAALERLARELDVDLTIVGPEAPLALGIVDRFRAAGLPVFGPTRAAAEIETSKAFAKQLMLDEGIPTARAAMHTTTAGAKAAARAFGAPVVIKASGLAAGKGVIVCDTLRDAERAIDDMLEGNRFGDAGHEVLVEEFMEGEEVSVFAITDGESFVVLPGLQDHKRLLDGDRGPNTGGMGAYLPVRLPDPHRAGDAFDVVREAALSIFIPTLRAMNERGRPFTGLLYAGLMLTRDGAKVVEFNCRFGDPETQALLPLVVTDPSLLTLMHRVATGAPLGGMPVTLDAPAATGSSVRVQARGACVTTVIAAGGYPDQPRTGDVITLPPAEPGVHVFHAGTARDAEGRLVSAGGRVLAVSALGADVADAHRRSLAFAARVQLHGRQLRTDIGWREIARGHSTTGSS